MQFIIVTQMQESFPICMYVQKKINFKLRINKYSMHPMFSLKEFVCSLIYFKLRINNSLMYPCSDCQRNGSLPLWNSSMEAFHCSRWFISSAGDHGSSYSSDVMKMHRFNSQYIVNSWIGAGSIECNRRCGPH